MLIKRDLFTADAVAWDGKHYEKLAAQLSEAIAGLSQAIAAALPMEAETSGKTTTGETKP